MDGLSVFNIQRYSIHDGDGIRTTIFLRAARCAVPGATIRKAGTPLRS